MGTRVIEIFALEQHARADLLGETRRFAQRRWATDIRTMQVRDLASKARIRHGGVVRVLELVERWNQGLRHIAAAEGAESVSRHCGGRHRVLTTWSASRNARMRS